MQQFVAAARTQSRPPLALIGVASEESERSSNQKKNDIPLGSSTSSRRTYPSARQRSDSETRALSSIASMMSSEHRMLSSLSSDRLSQPSPTPGGFGSPEKSFYFQDILKARKTTSRFAADQSPDQTFWKEALDRAVACGLTAPNHKRTEPFRFKRMIAPSESTQRLADIAFHVSLRKKTTEEAERKRQKWQQIPAFLITLVEGGNETVLPENAKDMYEPLDYVPPSSNLALEDYAAACAAVQNVLLSLHAEGIASKWATGPVIQTPAFRDLIQARPDERVVGMIMVGKPHVQTPIHQGPRRRRRRPMEELLQDL